MNPENRLKRLIFRSGHRGCKETDLILGQFAQNGLGGLPAGLLAAYERFLDENDVDIWNWLTGKETPADPDYEPLIALLKDYQLSTS